MQLNGVNVPSLTSRRRAIIVAKCYNRNERFSRQLKGLSRLAIDAAVVSYSLQVNHLKEMQQNNGKRNQKSTIGSEQQDNLLSRRISFIAFSPKSTA